MLVRERYSGCLRTSTTLMFLRGGGARAGEVGGWAGERDDMVVRVGCGRREEVEEGFGRREEVRVGFGRREEVGVQFLGALN